MTYAFGTLEEMGSGPGFRKVRQALAVEAFGVNAIVMAPGHEGFLHYHDTQDELYFVHRGTARFEVEGESRDLVRAACCMSRRRRRGRCRTPAPTIASCS